MQLTLVRNDTIYRLPLPAKVSGQYWVTCGEPDGKETELISVEGAGGTWVLKSNRRAWALDDEKRKVREARLEPNRFYEVVVGATRRTRRPAHRTDDRRPQGFHQVRRPAPGPSDHRARRDVRDPLRERLRLVPSRGDRLLRGDSRRSVIWTAPTAPSSTHDA